MAAGLGHSRTRGLRAPRRWLWLQLRSARLRLTLLYSGMFLVLGTVLVIVILLLSGSAVSVHLRATAVQQSGSVTTVMPLAPGSVGSGVVSQRTPDLGHLLAVSWLVLVITAFASAVLGWFAAGRVLAPLREMDERARRISAGNLGERLALTGPNDEFRRLGDTFDELLARLQSSFEAQRRFVANASHELRTPLTLERTLLQVALADPDASAERLRTTCEELLASGRDQERLLESLLTLASSERGLDRREDVDLTECARRALSALDTDRLGLAVDGTLGAARVAGDPALVQRLVANLVANAAGYNEPGGLLEVTTSTDARGRARLRVVNSGRVIDGADVARMFEPFRRLGDGDGRGAGADDGHHGLGLSIVRAIADAHGAEVDARPRGVGGLDVVVTFPPDVS